MSRAVRVDEGGRDRCDRIPEQQEAADPDERVLSDAALEQTGAEGEQNQ